MSDPTTTTQPVTDPDSIDEFLGTEEPSRLRKWAKFWVPGVAVLVLLLAVVQCSRGGGEPEYITEEVGQRALSITVTATGNLRPTNQVQVGSETSGRIDRVLVDVNDRVAQGQVLAMINTDVIEDQIKQAQANLNAARASVAQAGATLDVDTAQLRRLQDVYRVSGGKVPSKTELEAAEANVKRDRAGVASAQANVASQQAQLSSAITNRDRAVIRSPVSGVVLARQVEPGQTVAASFSTPTLFVIAEDLSAMQLRVNVDEADVGQVRPGEKASFTVDAYPGRQFPARVERIDLASTNTASTAASTGTTTTGTASVVNYEARLTVTNINGLLRPGMTATATIETGATPVSLLVPNGALRFDPDAVPKAQGGGLDVQVGLAEEERKATIGAGSRQDIHVLKADGKLEKIEVVTGQSDGRHTAVTSSKLKKGMKVVTGIKAAADK
jgi:HlyD family secretion protein